MLLSTGLNDTCRANGKIMQHYHHQPELAVGLAMGLISDCSTFIQMGNKCHAFLCHLVVRSTLAMTYNNNNNNKSYIFTEIRLLEQCSLGTYFTLLRAFFNLNSSLFINLIIAGIADL